MYRAIRKIARWLLWCAVFVVELILGFVACAALRAFLVAEAPSQGALVATAKFRPPQVTFACDSPDDQLPRLFSEEVIQQLRQAKAAITLALIDLSPQRAALVRSLNENGIPVTAWMALPKEQGYYANAANITQVSARFSEFEKWSRENNLHWQALGLDIEPMLQDFQAVRDRQWFSLIARLIRRTITPGSVDTARNRYQSLIALIQSHGFVVETYQFPFVADARAVHSTLLERLLGMPDVQGNREVLMTYTSFNPSINSALIWQYGRGAQVLAVGNTAGDPETSGNLRPLNWDEFRRDSIVASHFSPAIGIYNLEGSVRQRFLPRWTTIDWSQPVTLSSEADHRARKLRVRIQCVLWTGSHFGYLFCAVLAFNVWMVRRGGGAVRDTVTATEMTQIPEENQL